MKWTISHLGFSLKHTIRIFTEHHEAYGAGEYSACLAEYRLSECYLVESLLRSDLWGDPCLALL